MHLGIHFDFLSAPLRPHSRAVDLGPGCFHNPTRYLSHYRYIMYYTEHHWNFAFTVLLWVFVCTLSPTRFGAVRSVRVLVQSTATSEGRSILSCSVSSVFKSSLEHVSEFHLITSLHPRFPNGPWGPNGVPVNCNSTMHYCIDSAGNLGTADALPCQEYFRPFTELEGGNRYGVTRDLELFDFGSDRLLFGALAAAVVSLFGKWFKTAAQRIYPNRFGLREKVNLGCPQTVRRSRLICAGIIFLFSWILGLILLKESHLMNISRLNTSYHDSRSARPV